LFFKFKTVAKFSETAAKINTQNAGSMGGNAPDKKSSTYPSGLKKLQK
jgi:hypothetical protein